MSLAVSFACCAYAGAADAQVFAQQRSTLAVHDTGRSADVSRVLVSLERDGLPADGQSPARLSIELFDREGQPVREATTVTLQASAGRFQQPGANSDELGLAPRDADPVTPGFQLAVSGGRAQVWLLAPIEPQQVEVKVMVGAVTAQGAVTFVPELRDMLAVGLMEGIVSFDRKNPLSFGQARPDDGFEERLDSWARQSGDGKRQAALRTAFFLKGTVADDVLLTMAYDSDKPGQSRLFRDLDPERWFPVYGDGSVVGFDARSNSRLYLRMDRNRSYLMYGDIVTGDGFSQRAGQGSVAALAANDLGQYNRTMTGVRAHLEGSKGHLDVFGANDNLRQVVEEFPGRGLSGPYTVTNAENAVLGSETIQLVVRDRYAPSRIVSTRQLTRFSDYTFEPFSGRILFTEPVPSVDESLNPISVRITYEVDQGGEKYWVYGASGQYRPSRYLEIGGSIVNDENPLARYEIGSANATLNFSERTWLRGEVARTRSDANSINGTVYTLDPSAATGRVSGDAWRAEFGHAGDRSNLLAWYGQSDADFNNPASSYLGGRRQAGLDATWLLGDAEQPRWSLYAQGSWIEDTVNGGDRSQLQAGARWKLSEQLTLELGANHVSEHQGDNGIGNGLTTVGSLSAPYGVGVVSPGLGGGFFGSSSNALNPGTGQTLYNTGAGWGNNYGSWVGNGLAGVPVSYTALRVGAVWKPLPRLDVSGEVEQAVNASEYRRAALGAGWQVHERTRLYGRYEWNTGLSTVATSASVTNPLTGQQMPSPYETNAFVVGVDTEYMKGGNVFNEYRMYDALSATQAQWASGVRNQWRVNERLGLQTSFEKLQVLDGEGEAATSATLSADWRPSELWLASGRLEWRRTEPGATAVQGDDSAAGNNWMAGFDSWLSTLTVARKINRDWTAMVRNYYLVNQYQNGQRDGYEERFQAGFAYRDTDTNRVNVLAKYEYWSRRDSNWAEWGNTDALLTPSEGYNKHIVSVLADWHPSRSWWLTGRLAGKRQTDLFDGTRSHYTAYLAGGRVTFDVSERWDVSTAAYQMWSPGGARQAAAGVEVGYLVVQNLWLSAGYNVRGFRDDDMAAGEYTNQGMFLRLRFKFDENLFRGNDPAINRALPR